MKVLCPNCQHEGNIPDDKLPPRPFTATCNKCSSTFEVNPSHASNKLPSFYCPKCGTGQAVSDSCVKCGAVFSKLYNEDSVDTPKDNGTQKRSKEKASSFYCPKCGTGQTVSDSCVKCGAVFSRLYNEKEVERPQDVYQEQHSTPAETKSHSSKALVYGLLASIFLIVILLPQIISIFKPSKSSEKDYTATVTAQTKEEAPKSSIPKNTIKTVNLLTTKIGGDIHGTLICLGYLLNEKALKDKTVIIDIITKFENERDKVDSYSSVLSSNPELESFVESTNNSHILCAEIIDAAKRLMVSGRPADYNYVKNAAFSLSEETDSFIQNVPMDLLLEEPKKIIEIIEESKNEIHNFIELADKRSEHMEDYEYYSNQAAEYKAFAEQIKKDMRGINERYGD